MRLSGSSAVIILIVLLSTGLLGFGKKHRTLSDLCTKADLDRFGVAVQNAVIALRPWRDWKAPSVKSRQLATTVGNLNSTSNPNKGEPGLVGNLVGRDRESWRIWAEDRLKEIQEDLDLAKSHSGTEKLRNELSAIANELVAFHGYAVIGRTDKMNVTLERVSVHQKKASYHACHISDRTAAKR